MAITIREFYEEVNGDYESALSRILREACMAKFLKMLLDDPQYDRMMDGIEKKDYKQVFAASHDMKGTSANLGLTQLAKSSSDICEAVRNGEPDIDIGPLVDRVSEDYQKTIDAISRLE